ncbi:MAG TPA: methyltransferase [Acetobacteraceae bacterium]|nr:methyltransferase [Acetobacteraceae bacterium]
MTGSLDPALDDGTLLDGRVRHGQRQYGHRTGIEPVILAACVPARRGNRVLEAGTGSGAALLCLAARVPDLRGIGIERDPDLAAIARENLRANGMQGYAIVTEDITAFRSDERYDHAFANPPWHEPAGTPSPDTAREAAKRDTGDLLAAWAGALARPLRERGTLTFIVAAAVLPACLAGMTSAGCGGFKIAPLWPREGAAAKLVVVRSRRGGRSPCEILPGLVLHTANGGFTDAAEAILRHGQVLML